MFGLVNNRTSLRLLASLASGRTITPCTPLAQLAVHRRLFHFGTIRSAAVIVARLQLLHGAETPRAIALAILSDLTIPVLHTLASAGASRP